jgi:hypothetical protein
VGRTQQGDLGLQARYRPNLQILPFFSELAGACRTLEQDCLIKSLGKATALPSTFSNLKIFLQPTTAHRRKQRTVVFINFVGRYRVMKSQCLLRAALRLRS